MATASEEVAVVDGDGRIYLPAKIRESLDLTEGDEVVLVFDQGQRDQVTLRRRSAVERTFGIVPSLARPLSPHEMHRIFAEEIVAEYMREMSRTPPDQS